MHEYYKLLKQLDTASDQHTFQDLRAFIEQALQLSIAAPAEIAKYGTELLDKHSRKLTADDRWNIKEAVAIACMEIGSTKAALAHIDSISAAFPDSNRVIKLKGMYLESTGMTREAEAIYKAQLEKKPQNLEILRRLVALKKGQGDTNGALELLKAIVALHMTDTLAWEEMAVIYLNSMQYSQSIFCLEEMLLHMPGHINTMLLLADTLYTVGGPQNWRAARSYYAAITELTEGKSVRALYGISLCSAQLSVKQRGSGGGGSAGKGDEAGLTDLAAEALQQRYALEGPEKLALVKKILE